MLKNTVGLLPLSKQANVAIIGALAATPRFQGSGSSQINPTQLDIPLDEIQNLLATDNPPLFAPGYSLTHDDIDQQLIEDALTLARDAGTVVLFAGLPDSYESEGFDRNHMRLPAAQLKLIEAVMRVTDRLVVVLQNGAPVEVPFLDQVGALLETYLGGQAGGSAVARVLFGEVNPSGKLAETFPLRLEDAACHDWFPGEPRQVQYREGLWVGYRFFDTSETPVAFPFGHGLSYTTFTYHQLRVAETDLPPEQVDSDQLGEWDGLTVKCDIENTGAVAGYEIAQLYIGADTHGVYRPRRELRDFVKVWLEPGQTHTVVFELGRRGFAYWDKDVHDWMVEAGDYRIEIGASSADLRLSCGLKVLSGTAATPPNPALQAYFEPRKRVFDTAAFTALLGQPVPKVNPTFPYHPNSTLGEIRGTFIGRKLHKLVLRSVTEMVPDEVDEKLDRILGAMLGEMPLRNLVMLSGGKFPPWLLTLCIHLMNGQYWPALKTLISRGKR